MPFIGLRRTDIDPGVLQVLDLKPNSSQRSLIYEPPGQTKYVSFRPQNDTVATSGAGPILTDAEFKGIAAYLIDHVQAGGLSGGTAALTATQANSSAAGLVARLDGGLALALTDVNAVLAGVVANTDLVGGTSASGTISVDVNANITADVDTIEVAGITMTARSAAPSDPDYLIGANEGDTATNIAAAINNPSGSFVGLVTASALGSVVTVTAVIPGSAGDSLTLASSDLTAITVSGATLSGSTGSGSTGDLDELLRVMSGEEYVLPAGSSVDTDGSTLNAVTLGSFATTSRVRRTYDGGALLISLAEGDLAGYTSANFTYLGVSGPALVVYGDDGSLL